MLLLRGEATPAVNPLEGSDDTAQSAVREMELVTLGAGAAGEQNPVVVLEPKPRMSTIVPVVGHPVGAAVVIFTRATCPTVAERLVLPVKSGVGREVVPPPPEAS